MKLFGRCLLLLHLEMTQWEANNFVSTTLSLTFPVCPEAAVEDKIYVFFFLTVFPSLCGQVFFWADNGGSAKSLTAYNKGHN